MPVAFLHGSLPQMQRLDIIFLRTVTWCKAPQLTYLLQSIPPHSSYLAFADHASERSQRQLPVGFALQEGKK